MKSLMFPKTLWAAVALAASLNGSLHAQPVTEVALPANIAPESDAAQIVKLVHAGVEPSIIHTFIANCNHLFNLDAGKIIALYDTGVPNDILDEMMAHDRNLSAPVAVTPTVVTTVTTAPVAPITVNYFNETLSPYGSWVEVSGYGRCWRPTTVIYDTNWRPYCDRGHWVYTESGWYWDSDYAWGATFHYGRWFRDSRFGWCWWPDTDWAPSWVLWRSGEEHCGWAPLPPRCVYHETGLFYNGSHISVGFDFGYHEDDYIFVSTGSFCDRHLREHREDRNRVGEYFHNTTVINNYNYASDRKTIVNSGINAERVASASHHPVRPVALDDVPNAARQGWRGDGRNNHNPVNSGNFNNGNTTGHESVIHPGTPTSALNNNNQSSQHSSRLEQQQWQRQRNQDAQAPTSVTTPINQNGAPADNIHSPRPGQPVWQRQQNNQTASVTPPANQPGTPIGQPGLSLPNNNHSSRLEQQQQRQSENFRSQPIAQSPPIIQPRQPQQLPSFHYSSPRQEDQTQNHFNQNGNNVERNQNRFVASPATTPPPENHGQNNSSANNQRSEQRKAELDKK